MLQRSDFLRTIRLNIASYGYHVTVVTGGPLPRYAYTIGCTNTLGAEFILAGGEYYSQAQIWEIMGAIISLAATEPNWQNRSLPVGSLGRFSLVKAAASWSERLLLGAVDYYQPATLPVWQIVPDGPHHTLEIPAMAHEFEVAAQPVWQWLVREWNYPIPQESMALTNVAVLLGKKATEVMRWETDEWEIFAGAGPDVPKEDQRLVPLGVLLGLDQALERAVHLPLGKGLWRDPVALAWNDWG